MLPEFEDPKRGSKLLDPLELRAAPRVAVDLPTQLFGTGFRGSLPARTRDLGLTGACIATAYPFALKSVQRIVIDLPRGSLALGAEGVWQRDSAADDVTFTGVRFEEPEGADLDQLWDLVFTSGRSLARFFHECTELRELGIEEAFGLAQVSRYREIPAGRYIFRQDTRNPGEDSLFIVMSGSVALQVRVRGAIETEIERLGVGELFGGTPLLADVDHAESAVATVDTRLLEVDAAGFRHLRLTKPWLGYRLGQALIRLSSQRLQRVAARIRDEI